MGQGEESMRARLGVDPELERLSRRPARRVDFAKGLAERAAGAMERARRQAETGDEVRDWVLEQSVHTLRSCGRSVREISAELEVPKSTVGRVMRRQDRSPDMVGLVDPFRPSSDRFLVERGIEEAWAVHERGSIDEIRDLQLVPDATLETLLSLVGPAEVGMVMRGVVPGETKVALSVSDNFGRVLDWLWSSGRKDRAVLLVADLLSAIRGRAGVLEQPTWQELLRAVRTSLTSPQTTREELIRYVDDHVTGYFANAKRPPAAID